MANPWPMVDHNKNKRGPTEHIARIPLTIEEHSELEAVTLLERSTYSETMRRALREYAGKRRA